ncbi:MAG: glycosyltransferase family 9 protein [Gemmatimonadaceae bacterium]
MTKRVLIVKLAALGDVIMASTLVPAIRARQPDAEITWVVGEGTAPLVKLFSGVDRVISVNENALFKRGKISSMRTIARAWRAVGRGYELALIAHTDARYTTLGWVAGANVTHRFADGRAPRRGRWHGAEYLRLLDIDENAVEPPYAEFRADLLPSAPHVEGTGPLIVLAPGGGRNVLRDDPLRRWPIAYWLVVVRALVARGYRVVAVGATADNAEGAACAEAGASDLTGRTSLLELAALIHVADAVVTHDSGTLHLALLLDRPTVALFGPTAPEERIPVAASVVALHKTDDLSCAPCFDGFGYAECALNLCLTRVSTAEVIQAVEQQLKSPHAFARPV